MKKMAIAASLISVSVWFSIIVADIIIHFLFVSSQPPLQGLYINDDEIDYKLSPSFSGVYLTRGPSAKIKINSKGFRGPEWQILKKPRIAILGDSFTFGLPLNYEQGFVSKLSKKFSSFEFLNLTPPQTTILMRLI